MKNFKVLLLTLAFAFSANAKTHKNYKNLNYRPLLARIHQKMNANRLRIRSTQLLKFTMSPAEPKSTDEITLFVQPLTGVTDSDTLLDAKFDGVDIPAANFEHPAAELWVYDAGAFTELKSHTLYVKISLQDKNAAKLLTDAITVLDAAIADLSTQIDEATDPDIIADLTAQKADKESQRAELITALAGLKTQIGEESFVFNIGVNTGLAGYPKIFSVSPNIVSTSGSSDISILGQNFGASPAAKIEGTGLSISASTSSDISTKTPALSAGPHTVEVRVVSGDDTLNVFLPNAVFAVSTYVANPSTKPIAVAAAVSSPVSTDATAQVTGTGTYDANSKPLRYEWHFVSVPEGASQTTGGSPVGTSLTYSFTPKVPGFYVLKLEAIQTTGAQLASEPAFAVVEVTAPTNRYPRILAPPIAVMTSGTKTSQIIGADSDFWQQHSFYVVKQGTYGTASVNSDGLITYVAGGSAGSDTIQVMIVDNGTPPLQHTITVPANVYSSNSAPTSTAVVINMVSQNLPVAVNFLGAGITDSSGIGTLAEVKYNMGDGTSEYAPIAGGTLGQVTHNYHSYGSFSGDMSVTDSLGASSDRSFTVNVVNTDRPTAKFSLDKYSCSAPCTVSADGTAASDSVGITQYRWLWGDATAEEANAAYSTRTHTYSSNGTYRIRFRTLDSYGSMGEGGATVYVGGTPPGTGSPSYPDFNINPAREVTVGDPVSLDGTRSFDPNPSGSITNYAFYSGRCPSTGCSSSGASTDATFTYSSPTNYFPYLTTTNALGGTTTSAKGEIINVVTGHAPRPLFSVNSVYGPFGLNVTGPAPFLFTADSSISYDYDGSIVSRHWDFGDGTSSDVAAPAKVFDAPGVYFVTLTVTDDDGNAPTKTQMVTVTSRSGVKRLEALKVRSEDETRQNLTSACGRKDGRACALLAASYQKDGDSFVYGQLLKRSCKFGFKAACGKGQ